MVDLAHFASGRAADMQGLARQYSWLLSSRLCSAAFQGATLLLLARWTSPVGFGIAAKTLGVLIVLGAIADLGLGALLLRERSVHRQTPVTVPILRLNAIISSILCVTTTAGLLIMGLTSTVSYLLLLPLGAWVAIEKNGDLWLNIATADGLAHLSALNILTRRVISLALMIGLSKLGLPMMLAFAVALTIGSVVANIGLRLRLREPNKSVAQVRMPTLIRAAFPFYLNTVATQIRNIDVALVSALAGPIAGGIYAVPARLTSPLRMLPTALNPIIVRYSSLGTFAALGAVRKVSIICMIVMPLLMLGLMASAGIVVNLTLGPAYASAVLPLRIICLGLIFAFAVSLQTSFLQGRGEERYVGRAGIGMSMYVLLALAAGSYFWGVWGAATAVSSSYLLHCLVLARRTRRTVKEIQP